MAKLLKRAVSSHGCLVLPKQGTRRYFDIVVSRVDGKPKHIGAHRLAFQHYHGFIPAGLEVCHSCDNGYCISKEHLFLGTHRENMRDRNAKGRIGTMGSKAHFAKLTEAHVSEILRRSAEPACVLAASFNVSSLTISRIVKGQTWQHVARGAK